MKVQLGCSDHAFNASASLTVTQCFFHKCSLDSTIRGGGAVLVVASSTQPEPLTIKSSSFTECSTSSSSENKPTGGAVAGVVCTQITMENCFFETCSAHQGGGLVSDRSPTTISNCVFVACVSNHSGGALSMAYVKSLTFSFLQFRECQSTSITNSSDIRFSNISNETVSNSIMFCDSTSGSPNVYFAGAGTDGSTWFPKWNQTNKQASLRWKYR
ncbi:hypothetical protein BLNAU_23810 [Blattamonas nauphoetae]|uniref:Right handed beta helix domain-containing protein n=1 Tax=Blattamonas nauphoetae TaxID=2049346 RepID=A0ABQ9WQ68_9EUKA|nr:hypothetical protein BLNAU_23810 [Blattamonas nauphoetae]